MHPSILTTLATGLLALLLGAPGALGALGTGGAEDGHPEGVSTHRGRAICLDARLQPLDELEHAIRCNEPGAARYGLRTVAGEMIFFLPDDPLAEMFIDPIVRSRELVVKGWSRPDRHFEILRVLSFKNGQLHHIHYRCDVCNITAKAPGPCWCCRKPFELREVPVEGEGASGPEATAGDRDGSDEA